MHTGFWFNRIIEYWNLPTADLVLDHVRRGKVQVVQVGNFGVDFYGLADDPEKNAALNADTTNIVPLYGSHRR